MHLYLLFIYIIIPYEQKKIKRKIQNGKLQEMPVVIQVSS